MKPKYNSNFSQATALLFLAASSSLFSQATFLFPNNNSLDGAGIGGTLSAIDTTESLSVTMTTTEITGNDGTLASDSINHRTNSTSSNHLGVNSLNDNGYSNESRDFNPGEAWTFSFDVDVRLNELDFSGWSSGSAISEITVSSSAFTSFILTSDDTSPNDSTDGFLTFLDPTSMEGPLVPANTDITIAMTSGTDPLLNDTGVRLANIIVNAIPPVAGAELIWAGGNGIWDTSLINFTSEGTPIAFSTGNNVTIDTASAVALDAIGITAGQVNVTHPSGIASLSTGLLTASGLSKSGASNLVVNNEILIESGVFNLAEGTATIGNGGFLDTNFFTASNGATLELEAGSDFLSFSGSALGAGGFTLDLEEPLTLGNIANTLVQTPFIKTGSETLTLTAGMGSQTTGPVRLDILEGTVIATGTSAGGETYIGGTSIFDGNLILDGPILHTHGSTILGTGSIIIQSPSTIETRFNAGNNMFQVPVVMDSDFAVDSPTQASESIFEGPVSGIGNFTKIGNGTTVLVGPASYTGTTTLTSGTLLIDGDASTATGAITLETAVGSNRPGRLGGNGQSGAAVTMQTNTELTLTISDWATGAGVGYTDLLVDSLAITNPITVVVETADLVNFTETGSTFTFLNTSNGITGFDPAQVTLNINGFAGTGTWAIAQVSNSLALTYTEGSADDFGTWASEFGITGGPTDDDDSDGVNNETEYAFGLDPTSGGSVNAIADVLDASTGVFSFTRRDTTLSALTYTYEYSTTLESADWMPLTPTTESGDAASPVETVTVTVPATLLSNGKLFVRVIAQ